jgi:hypothetical protein
LEFVGWHIGHENPPLRVILCHRYAGARVPVGSEPSCFTSLL